MKQLVILAGGKGTRLKEKLGDLPKPLVDVCGKPLLEHQILLAKRYGFTDIMLLIGYAAEKIREFCQDGKKWGVAIRYYEEQQPLGTAGAVLACLPELAEQFMVMYGDTMLNVDLERLWQIHMQNKADITLFLHPNDHPHDSDLVDIDENGWIRQFYPYPHAEDKYYPNLVNAALYVVCKDSLSFWNSNTQGMVDLAKNLFPQLLEHGVRLLGYRSPEYIKDIGTPRRLDNVCRDFSSGKIQKSSFEKPSYAIFLDRDGTLNVENGHIKRPEELYLIDNIALAIRKINKSSYRAILITNQPVIARGECNEEDLNKIHNKLETLLGKEGAYLDRIYYCPHHPDKGFKGERVDLKVRCQCRKPEIGLIKRAQQEFNIALEGSWFIGNTSIDIQTAKNAGIRAVLVRSKEGIDDNYSIKPDFAFSNLSEAIDFIIDNNLIESINDY